MDIVLDKDKQALKLLGISVGGNPVVHPGSLGCCRVILAANVSIATSNTAVVLPPATHKDIMD